VGRHIYQHDKQDPHSLSHDRVYCITEDVQGALWIWTDGGLNVPPGTYTFRVKAANDDGLWNGDGNGLLTLTQFTRMHPAVSRIRC
jgi:hypothetical protein